MTGGQAAGSEREAGFARRESGVVPWRKVVAAPPVAVVESLREWRGWRREPVWDMAVGLSVRARLDEEDDKTGALRIPLGKSHKSPRNFIS